MKNFLFDEFDKVSPAAWKQKIQVDLKGADYNDSLVWKSNDGISVKPFYTKEDRHYKEILLPDKGFKICQSVYVDDVIIANKLALDSLDRGANAIQFTAKSTFDFKTLLAKIDLDKISIYFNLEFLDTDFITLLANHCEEGMIYYQIDIIGNLAKTGNWFDHLQSDISQTKKLFSITNQSICVDASLYQNAGATIHQELAYSLAHTNEYLEMFGKSVATKMHFSFSVGSHYFFEIAKLRAFRLLISTLFQAHGVSDNGIHIFTKPSLRNKTVYDYNVNMLRSTSECMSAILGGADTISNLCYDSVYHKSNEFGERIARNQLLILQKEAYLSDSQKFANGAYYIESIEKQLAEKALIIFKQLENKGGFLKQLKIGLIQKKIAESAQQQQNQFDQNQLILLGSNKLPNKNDRMKDELELYPFLKHTHSKTLISPILQTRLSENYEMERLRMEKQS